MTARSHPSEPVQEFVNDLLAETRFEQEVEDKRAELREKYPELENLYFSVDDHQVFLHEIKVREQFRGQGVGARVMADLKDFARDLALPLVLAPEPERGKKDALDRFYRRQGLVPNKGRHRDYRLSSVFGRTMYWKPPVA